MSGRIILGDCLEVMQEIPTGTVDLVLTDPPYGITANDWDELPNLEALWIELKRVARDGAVFVFTASQPFTTDLINSNRAWSKYEWIWEKTRFSNQMSAKVQPLKIHENIIVFYKGKEHLMKRFGEYIKAKRTELGLSLKQIGELCNEPWYYRGGHMFFETGLSLPSKAQYYKLKEVMQLDNRFDDLVVPRIYNPQGLTIHGKTTKQGKRVTDNIGGGVRETEYIQEFANYPRSIQRFQNETGLHPTQKPVSLMRYLIETYSNKGDTVLDPFAGSGTTIVATKETGRKGIGIEIDPKYVEIAQDRLKQEVLL